MTRCGPGSSTSPPHLRGGDPILLCGTRRGFWLPGGDGPGRGGSGRDEAHGACAEHPCGLYRHYEVLPGGLLQLVGAVAVRLRFDPAVVRGRRYHPPRLPLQTRRRTCPVLRRLPTVSLHYERNARGHRQRHQHPNPASGAWGAAIGLRDFEVCLVNRPSGAEESRAALAGIQVIASPSLCSPERLFTSSTSRCLRPDSRARIIPGAEPQITMPDGIATARSGIFVTSWYM